MYIGEFSVAIKFRGDTGEIKDDIVKLHISSPDRDPEILLSAEVKKYCLNHYGKGLFDWSYEGTVVYPNGTTWFVESGERGCGDDICAVTKRLDLSANMQEEIVAL